MNPIYKRYKDRLIEISGRNRSLYSKNITRKNAYDIGALLKNAPGSTEDFFNFLWKGKRGSFNLIDIDSPVTKSNIARNIVSTSNPTNAVIKKSAETEIRSLNYLKREISEIEKETGRYELFIGYPFVEGFIGKDIAIRAPLILFPVRLNIDKGKVDVELTPFESVQINKALMLACSNVFRVDISDFEYEIDNLADAGIKNIAGLVDYLNKKGIKLHYSERKNLVEFTHGREPKIGDKLEIKNCAVIGRFAISNSIYDDYNVLEKRSLTTDAIRTLITGKEKKVKKQKDQQIYSINQLDYAQENAIDLINKTGSIVIYGPPGTGKSQTIVNIISDAICKNKRVLVVSQKKAALDVVFNRLKELNKKAIILSDAEKNKFDFYERVRNTHNEIINKDSSNLIERFKKVESDLENEVGILQSISNTLMIETGFGLSLQEMYAQSYILGKKTHDYMVYEAMQKSDIIKLNYDEISSTIRLINDKNLDKLYYEYFNEFKKNPLIGNLILGLNMHKVNQAKKFISGFLNRTFTPFNTAEYPNSRYLVTYLLEQSNININGDAHIKQLAGTIRKLQTGSKRQSLDEIKKSLVVAQEAIVKHLGPFDEVRTIIDQKGFAVVVDGIINGNFAHLRKILSALNSYTSIQDMQITIKGLTRLEKMVLEFAYDKSKNESSFKEIVHKLLPIRIYHEIVNHERQYKKELSDTMMFEDIRNRIISLKKEQLELVKEISVEKFNDDYKNHFATSPQNKNFLHEILKQRGFMPVRRLLEKYKDFLLKLFPCWLLSPETVSTVMPLEKELFDLVIFDEASQIFIENAIPTIYRGKYVAISGDNKQLRPTNAFVKRYLGSDAGEEDSDPDASINAALKVESLLDLATSRYSSAHLTYHYRSIYEELINFSNYAFYNGKLQIAPNTSRSVANRPIIRMKVAGEWIDRHNHKEAVAIVELVKKLFKTRKNKETIGVITFNTEQEGYIKDLLDAEASKDEAFKAMYFKELNRKEKNEDVSFFVKNIENVQGDERDIIIFSIGYAKNENERIVAQFGSLSQVGGENRLNVAITRAKQKIYVITSIEPEELSNVENSKNPGPKILKKYLQYVRAISNGDKKEARLILNSFGQINKGKSELIGFEKYMKSDLEKLGYTVFSSIGEAGYKIALGIYDRKQGRFVLGIETDVSAYRSSVSTLERDVYRPKFLESRGWNLMRVWGRDWWQNKERVLREITTRVEAEMKGNGKTHVKAPKTEKALKASKSTVAQKKTVAKTTKVALKTKRIKNSAKQSQPR